jgi:hypothetical protein
MTAALRLMDSQRFVDWSFGHYLRIAPPDFVAGPQPSYQPLTAAATG